MPTLSGRTAPVNKNNWATGNRNVAAKRDAIAPIEITRGVCEVPITWPELKPHQFGLAAS